MIFDEKLPDSKTLAKMKIIVSSLIYFIFFNGQGNISSKQFLNCNILWSLSKSKSDEVFCLYHQNSVRSILNVNSKGIGFLAEKYVRIRKSFLTR